MEISNRTWIIAGTVLVYAIVFFSFFAVVGTEKGVPVLYQFSTTLGVLVILTLAAFFIAGEKFGFMTVGITLVATSLIWILAPVLPYVWAFNYQILADAVKAVFGLDGLVYAPQDKIVFLINAVWFFVLCLGCALIKASPILINGFAKAVDNAATASGTTARLADAKWATRKQVTDKLSVPGGIVLGELTNASKDSPNFEPHEKKSWGKQGKGQLISMSPETGNGHIFVISESSGFKTTGMVIPNIVTYNFGPIFVLDPKGDLYARTAHSRREMGYNPIVITAKNGLDPLKMLEPLLEEHPSIIREMAANLLPQSPHASEESKFFRERGLDLLSPLLYLAIKQDAVSAPEYISTFLSQPHNALLDAAKDISEASDLPFIVKPMARVAAVDTKGFESFIRTVSNKFAFSEYPDVKGFVEQPADSKRHQLALHQKTDVYLNISTATLETFDPIARLLLASFLTAAKMTEQPENPSCRRLFILDEAKGLGNMDILSFIRDEGRAVGLHLMMFYQTWDQFKKIWRDGAGAWEDSTEARIMGASQNASRAQALQDIIGHDTFTTTTSNTSHSARGIEVLGTRQKGHHEQIKEAPLMTKADISTIKRHGCLILTRSVPPILASKAIYFTRKDMKDLVRSTQEIKDELVVTQTAKAFSDTSEIIDLSDAGEDVNLPATQNNSKRG